jgi:hypothetical protein
VPAIALDATLGLTLGAMRGAASDATRDSGLDGAGPDGVAVEEGTNGGFAFNAFEAVLLLRLASLTGEEVAMEFPAVPETGVSE